MKSREHVTTNGRAVFFAAMWEDLRQAAISHGWALGLHGSLSSDMDIMAMPWDEHPSPVGDMITQLCLCFTDGLHLEKTIRISTDRPNNRTVYTLSIWADFYLDINVINPNPHLPPTMKEPDREQLKLRFIDLWEGRTIDPEKPWVDNIFNFFYSEIEAREKEIKTLTSENNDLACKNERYGKH